MGKDILEFKIWHKIIDKFNLQKLDYVLVGAAALVVYGLPRSTLDIDIYIPAKEQTLHKLFQLASSLGLESEQKAILNIAHSPRLFANQWICFSYKGKDILDVFLCEEDEFRRLLKGAELKQDKSISVRVASLKDIEIMKKTSGRPTDLADLELIKELKNIKRLHRRKKIDKE